MNQKRIGFLLTIFNGKINIKLAFNIISFIFIGFCLGLLTGLSISPVIQSILSSFIALTISIFIVLIGLKNSSLIGIVEKVIINFQSLTLFPFAIFLLFFTLGSFAGICARTNDLLGQNLDKQVKKWTDLGINRDTVIRDLYDQNFNERENTPYI